VGNRCYMRLTNGHCEALSVELEATRFVCSVYLTRPELCRKLEPGSPECFAEIERKRARAQSAAPYGATRLRSRG
jgi:hypothetical protein